MSNYKKVKIGVVDNKFIYLSPPSWDCGWYWGWGYLGNNNCHYHLNGLDKSKNLKTAIDDHFVDSYLIRPSQRWEFAELVQSFYKLKDMAEVYNKGGCYLTKNSLSELIKNKDEVKRINEVLIPAIFEKCYEIINSNLNNKDLLEELQLIDLEGLTENTYKFMIKNDLKPEDIKKSVSKNDYRRLHSKYWEEYHKNKNKDEKNNKC